jgi:hypothetical protein
MKSKSAYKPWLLVRSLVTTRVGAAWGGFHGGIARRLERLHYASKSGWLHPAAIGLLMWSVRRGHASRRIFDVWWSAGGKCHLYEISTPASQKSGLTDKFLSLSQRTLKNVKCKKQDFGNIRSRLRISIVWKLVMVQSFYAGASLDTFQALTNILKTGYIELNLCSLCRTSRLQLICRLGRK